MDADLQAHIQQDFREVHGRLFQTLKTYVDEKPAYVRFITPAALSLTMDGNDHDYDFTAATNAHAIAVILELRQTSTGTAGRWVKPLMKAKGAAAWFHDGSLEIYDSTGANCRIPLYGAQWIQPVDSGQEITYNISQEGVTTVYLVGYFKQEG